MAPLSNGHALGSGHQQQGGVGQQPQPDQQQQAAFHVGKLVKVVLLKLKYFLSKFPTNDAIFVCQLSLVVHARFFDNDFTDQMTVLLSFCNYLLALRQARLSIFGAALFFAFYIRTSSFEGGAEEIGRVLHWTKRIVEQQQQQSVVSYSMIDLLSSRLWNLMRLFPAFQSRPASVCLIVVVSPSRGSMISLNWLLGSLG